MTADGLARPDPDPPQTDGRESDRPGFYSSGSAGSGPALAVFTLTTFLSALLLFSVQPLFAKMVLPVLGGAPSVWAVALCFFQGALLAGYAYAHALNRWLPPRSAGIVHLGVGLAAALSLPLGLPSGWSEPPPGEPYLWQLGLFAAAVGLPFLAVSANAPLLQAWFSATGHPHARDPYFLYAASNLGSLIALLGYPLVLEPVFGLRALSLAWTAGYGALLVAIAACWWQVRTTSAQHGPAAAAEMPEDALVAPTWPRRLGWVGLALVPSALLTALTTHIATDVASAPLIWVIPLALYLLTFVLVFRERLPVPPSVLLLAHLTAVLVALLNLAQTKHDSWIISSGTGVAAFFLSAMVAHRTLYNSRPPARHLTEFYLWMSLGGGLGGVFAALVAPRLFSEVLEYPILIALTMACRPRALTIGLHDTVRQGTLAILIAAGIVTLMWGPAAISQSGVDLDGWGSTAVIALLFAVIVTISVLDPPRQLVGTLLLCAAVVTLPSSVKRGDAQRSYFGVYRISQSSDGEYSILTHGTTLHGAQRIRDASGALVTDTTPGTYYYPKSPMAQAVEILRASAERDGRVPRIGVIGLGTGSLACLSKPGERWRFFEIDPVMVRIATDPANFTFMSTCQPAADIVLGDARLTLAKEPDASYDLIIVDAFSSDAVPVHLMTAEALRLYASKLNATGVVVLHISNRYLDLDSVVGATAPAVPELSGLIVSDDDADGSYAASTSSVAVLSKSPDAIKPFEGVAEATELKPGGLKPWTDDFSDVLGPFLNRMR